jgi:predicted phosphodiesterase
LKKIVVISDLQVPYHDERAVRNVASFIRRFKPDQVITIGDEIDLPQVSRWTEGTPGWFEQTLGSDRDATVEILWDLQVTDMIRSNHTDRLYNVIMKKIPAFLALPELKFEKFMKLDELGIKFHRKPLEFAPDWIAIHGDEGSVKPTPGLTALDAARKHGKSVVCGHTHRAGQSAFTEASGGVLGRILRGVEVGNLMDFKKAGYMKGTGNWQQAFAVFYVDKKTVTNTIVHIEKDGSFVFEGKRYG